MQSWESRPVQSAPFQTESGTLHCSPWPCLGSHNNCQNLSREQRNTILQSTQSENEESSLGRLHGSQRNSTRVNNKNICDCNKDTILILAQQLSDHKREEWSISTHSFIPLFAFEYDSSACARAARCPRWSPSQALAKSEYIQSSMPFLSSKGHR